MSTNNLENRFVFSAYSSKFILIIHLIIKMNAVLENIQLKKKAKTAPVLEKIKKELVRFQKVLYGGMAQNLHLPKKHRFYKDTDIPDYDVYSYKAKAFSVRLAKQLSLEVRCAKNPGTYKLYWENIAVLDVTDVSLAEHRKLRASAKKTPEGLLLAPIELLKANAYLELASPDTAWFRWKKVYERIGLLERILKTKKNNVLISKRTKNDKGPLITGFHAARFQLGLPFEPELAPLRFTSKDQCIATDPKNKDFANLFHVLHLGYKDLYEQGQTDIPIRTLLQKVSEKKLHSQCRGIVKTHKKSQWTFKA
jgi:hypothetical protein